MKARCGSRTARRKAIASLAIGLSLVLAPRPGAASPATSSRESAAELFRSGEQAYARGDFLAAAHAFEAAYAEHPTVASGYNALLAWKAGGALARAHEAAARLLARTDLPPALREEVQETHRALAEQTAELVVQGAGSVSVAHALRRPLPARITLRAGAHRVTIHRADGTSEARSLTVSAGERVSWTSASPKPPEDAPSLPAVATGPSAGWILGWTSIGLAGAAATVAAVVGFQGLEARDRWVASGLVDLDAHDRAIDYRTGANVAWVGAAAFSVAGVVLLATSSEAALAVAFHPPGRLELRW